MWTGSVVGPLASSDPGYHVAILTADLTAALQPYVDATPAMEIAGQPTTPLNFPDAATAQTVLDKYWWPDIVRNADGTFPAVAPRGPFLSDVAAAALAQVDLLTTAAFANGYTVTTGTLAGQTLQVRNNTDRTNWLTSQGAYQVAIANGQGATVGAVFRTASNQNFTLTYNEGLSVLMDMAAWGQAVYGRAWALKDAINAAATIDAVNAIDVTTGWPA